MSNEDKAKELEIKMRELADQFDELMVDAKAKGFTIGRGRKLYWFITPMPSGYYKCYGYEKGDTLSWSRQVEVEDKITIHY